MSLSSKPISTEYQEEFEEMGGEHVDLVPSLIDDPRWIKAVADIIVRNDVRARMGVAV